MESFTFLCSENDPKKLIISTGYYGFEFFVKIVYAYHNCSSASFQNKNIPPYRHSSRIWSTSGRRTLESNFTPPRETLRVFECEDGNKQGGGSSKDITGIWQKRCF